VVAAAAASFMLAWAVELWLVVLAIPSGAVLMITFWVRTRWRLLPRVIAVETVTAVEDTWDDQKRTSIALALTAFQIELSQRYGLDYRLSFKLLPADLPT
jgi:hypothetical protein